VITAYVLGLPYGPSGVALAYSVAMTLWLIPHLLWCMHGTMISLRDLVPVVGRPLASAMVAVAFTYIVQSLYAQSLAPLPRLVLGCGILLLVYLWMLLFVMGQKALFLDLLRGLKGWPSLTKTTS
jgi:PST family polysaccharide transporter